MDAVFTLVPGIALAVVLVIWGFQADNAAAKKKAADVTQGQQRRSA